LLFWGIRSISRRAVRAAPSLHGQGRSATLHRQQQRASQATGVALALAEHYSGSQRGRATREREREGGHPEEARPGAGGFRERNHGRGELAYARPAPRALLCSSPLRARVRACGLLFWGIRSISRRAWVGVEWVPGCRFRRGLPAVLVGFSDDLVLDRECGVC
jgi:hypothetical protein